MDGGWRSPVWRGAEDALYMEMELLEVVVIGVSGSGLFFVLRALGGGGRMNKGGIK